MSGRTMHSLLPVAMAMAFVSVTHAFHMAGTSRATCARRVAAAAPCMALPSDDDLFASLRARVSQSEAKDGPPPPLGPDEVGADSMGPQDVVDYIMKSLKAQAADGCSTDGCKAMLAFCIKCEDKPEDFVGQLQPGYFADPQGFIDYLAAQPRYRTLTALDEYKVMGTPDFSDMSRKAVQKLLVRRDGANWEDLHINMQMVEVEGRKGADELPGKPRRWLVTSIYKQNHA